MERSEKRIDEEMEDLRSEMESFKKEKERVRAIVGTIGGMPSANTWIINVALLIVIISCLVLSFTSEGAMQIASLELALAALSGKIIYLIHNQNRVNHFQLWILSSLEWRLNEVLKKIDELKKG